ncbi:hypothetical protein JCM24511_02016 [Saitozyma sp. JCM 24511]|nr:hypothetical protein JCM24511_02016 [Saitozyma sp. JCM 24511]
MLYSLLHDRVDGLPPLPKISVHYDYSDNPGWVSAAAGASRLGGASALVQGTGGGRCTCGATDDGKRMCEVYGAEGLERSRLVQGSGARMKRMLAKAQAGKDIKIGVLGGSVSACHGVHPRTEEFPKGDKAGAACYTTLVTDWFARTFPQSKVELSNGAVGGTDSSYHSFCGVRGGFSSTTFQADAYFQTHHIAHDSDLIILDFDVNDQPEKAYQQFFDQLLRVLLELDHEPAVVILGAWAPLVAKDYGYGDSVIVHLPIAHYYDVPYISLKRLMFNHFLRYPYSTARSFYQLDRVHPVARGHRILADLLISYFDTELCLLAIHGVPESTTRPGTLATTEPFSSFIDIPFPMDTLFIDDPSSAPQGWDETFDEALLPLLLSESRRFVVPTSPFSVPPVGLFTPLSEVNDPTQPDPTDPNSLLYLPQPDLFCADSNDPVNPMRPQSSEGWTEFVWNKEKHYWVSDKVGARIRVDIKANEGRVAVYYFRSQHYHLGDAKCWVDDNEKGAKTLRGHWDLEINVPVVEYIDEKLYAGDHFVTCEIAETTSHPTDPDAHHFRIVAIMAT